MFWGQKNSKPFEIYGLVAIADAKKMNSTLKLVVSMYDRSMLKPSALLSRFDRVAGSKPGQNGLADLG